MKGKKPIKTKADLAEAMASPKNAGKSVSAVALTLDRSPQSVHLSLKDDEVQDLIVRNKQSQQDKAKSLVGISKQAAERSTIALSKIMGAIAKKIEDGESVSHDEQSKLVALQDRFFKCYAKGKELGLDDEVIEEVTPAEAIEIANEIIHTCRHYSTLSAADQAKLEDTIREQVSKTGSIDTSDFAEFPSTDVGHLAHPHHRCTRSI